MTAAPIHKVGLAFTRVTKRRQIANLHPAWSGEVELDGGKTSLIDGDGHTHSKTLGGDNVRTWRQSTKLQTTVAAACRLGPSQL